MESNIPGIIKEVGFGFSWDEKKVWALNEPVTEIPISELEWHFDIPFLWENGVYNLTPREVINNQQAHTEEYNRTMDSDIAYPIDIMENKGRWLILDGLHRLMKLSIQGEDKIKVRKIPRTRISEISI